MFIASDSDEEKLERDIKYIGGIIKRVNNFNMNSLEGRAIFQKTVYLIQASNINLGYAFNWYLKGVYSPKLADIGYKLKDRIGEITTSKFKDPEIERKFEHFRQFIEPYKNEMKMLEVFSSLHWIKIQNPTLEKDMIIDLLYNKKNIDIKIIEKGWDMLKNEGLI